VKLNSAIFTTPTVDSQNVAIRPYSGYIEPKPFQAEGTDALSEHFDFYAFVDGNRVRDADECGYSHNHFCSGRKDQRSANDS
jgi:hypothetical protein